MAYDFTETFVTYMQEGNRPQTKFPQGVPLDNNGQYQTILCNAWQDQEILNNIGQYHNNLKNIITTQKRESWNSHFNNIEQYWTILDNIVQYFTILQNIWQYLTKSENIWQYLATL